MDRFSRSLQLTCFALISLCCFHPVIAQIMSGRISGALTDPSGAAIVGARVTVTNTDTQLTRSLTSDDRGFYVAENRPIGNTLSQWMQPASNVPRSGG